MSQRQVFAVVPSVHFALEKPAPKGRPALSRSSTIAQDRLSTHDRGTSTVACTRPVTCRRNEVAAMLTVPLAFTKAFFTLSVRQRSVRISAIQPPVAYFHSPIGSPPQGAVGG